MVQNDDDQSFFSALSIAELLHPETAASTITRRHHDESTWATVYYEAVSGPEDYENMPIAVDVVAIQHDMEEANPQIGVSPLHHPSARDPRTSTPRHLPQVQPWQHSNLVDLILGFALSLAAFICTIKIEVTAIIIYTIAAGFYYLAENVFSTTPALLGKTICLAVCGVLMVVDPILLTVSVIVTELLGGIALLLCSIFGGPRSGHAWHQFIRKTCHLTRWGFRKCHKGWKPDRIFPISMDEERLQLGVGSSEEPENVDGDLECVDPSHRPYSDSSPSSGCCDSQRCGTCPCACITAEESTMISEVTLLGNEGDMEYPPIAIAPENVSVVPDSPRDEPLFKNAQQVTMT